MSRSVLLYTVLPVEKKGTGSTTCTKADKKKLNCSFVNFQSPLSFPPPPFLATPFRAVMREQDKRRKGGGGREGRGGAVMTNHRAVYTFCRGGEKRGMKSSHSPSPTLNDSSSDSLRALINFLSLLLPSPPFGEVCSAHTQYK